MSLFIAEDDEDDRFLLQEALSEAQLGLSVFFAKDGMDLFELLDAHEDERTLILLDLNMPRMDGREVLAALRRDPRRCRIPVVVLSTSESPRDIDEAYALGANTYLTKPPNFGELVSLLSLLDVYWNKRARHPTAPVATAREEKPSETGSGGTKESP